jgi:hypothetical protein
MRVLTVLALLVIAPVLSAADPPPVAKSKARAEAAAALALAASCDCPAGDQRCGRVVADVLARVSAEIDAEQRHPTVAPPPREKVEPKVEPVAVLPQLPATFTDAAGCTWTETAPGSGTYTRTSCPLRR